MIRVTLNITDGRTLQITVAKDENVHESVAQWLECHDADDLRYVQLGDVTVGDDESFEDAGVEDGARLGVCIEEMTVDEALERLVDMGAAGEMGVGPCSATEVCFKDMDFETLPREIFKLLDLHTLHLHDCKALTTLPREIAKFTKLKSLNLSGCTGLKTLPREIAQLTDLEFLILRDCTGLQSLPQEMVQLTHLINLTLNGCICLEAPPDLSELPCLTTVHTWKASAAAKEWHKSLRRRAGK